MAEFRIRGLAQADALDGPNGLAWLVQPVGGMVGCLYPSADGFTADEALDAYVADWKPTPGTELSVQLVGPITRRVVA